MHIILCITSPFFEISSTLAGKKGLIRADLC